MLHNGTRTTTSDLTEKDSQKVKKILDHFMRKVKNFSNESKLRLAVVRSQLSCNLTVLIDDENIVLLAEPTKAVVGELLV